MSRESIMEWLRGWRHGRLRGANWLWSAARPAWRSLAYVVTGGRGFRHRINGVDEFRLALSTSSNAAPIDWEPEQYADFMACVRPGSQVLDVGASIGLFSLGAALRAGPEGRVLAVEPSPITYRRLCANTRANRLHHRVMAVEEVCSDKAGEQVPFYSSGDGAMVDSAVPRQEGARKFIRRTTTIDELVGRHHLKLDLIKIDVEGFEDLVLAGGARTLREQRPVVFVEFHPHDLHRRGSSSRKVLDLLREEGYSCADPRLAAAPEPPLGILFPFRRT